MSFVRLVVLGALLAPAPTSSQPLRESASHLVVGSEEENYLRYLQAVGLAGDYPWSLRPFSQPDLERLAARSGQHPRSGRSEYRVQASRIAFTVLPLNTVLRFNSAFPYGSNDGAVWAGRGLTSSVDAGFYLKIGPFSAAVNPVAFRAHNRAFPLQLNGQVGNLRYGDGLYPTTVDHPQRFGETAYTRVDPGQSYVRMDLFGVTAGLSTQNLGWGPMETFEFVSGANAPGIPHIFAGTSRPVNVWIGRLHGQLIWGRIEQSDYSPVEGTTYYSSILETGTRRFASGIVATLQPRGVPGLELGGARFFHSFWPKEGLPRSYFTKPFESLVKISIASSPAFPDGTSGDNQLASLFARWVFPKSGFEAYGEYGREDHNYDRRDLVQEPDHSRTYGLGIRKVLSVDSAHLNAFRAEMINYGLPALARNRGEGGIYVHSILLQGHTNRGQVLGSDAGIGSGGGSLIAWDRYDRRGATSISWMRTIREQDGRFFTTGVTDPRANDVQNALTFARERYLGNAEFTTGLTVVREFNRDLQADAWNVNLAVGVRLGPPRRQDLK